MTGLRLASLSRVVSARTDSSASTTMSPRRDLMVTGAISPAKKSAAAAAR